jgi:hypothetical protein
MILRIIATSVEHDEPVSFTLVLTINLCKVTWLSANAGPVLLQRRGTDEGEFSEVNAVVLSHRACEVEGAPAQSVLPAFGCNNSSSPAQDHTAASDMDNMPIKRYAWKNTNILNFVESNILNDCIQ